MAGQPSSGNALKGARGGHKQKARWEAELARLGNEEKPSKLAEYLKEKWGWGLMSGPTVQEIAHAGVEDGLKCPDLVMLSKLGCSGKYPGKCHSELLDKLPINMISEQLFFMCVYYKMQKILKGAQHCMLLPHELFAAFYIHHRQHFVEHILGGTRDNLSKFWNDMVDHPALASHPMTTKAGWKQLYVPLSLHGDGVAISGVGRSWSRSVDVFSWASLVGKGCTILTNFLIYLWFPKFICSGAGIDSLGLFMKRLAWSFYWLAVGKWPNRDWHGKPINDDRAGMPLADGLCGILWCFRADLDFLVKGYGLENYNSTLPCVLCEANTSDIPWTDAKPTAKWIKTIWSKCGWHQAHPTAHPLLKLVPGISILNFIPDIMHVLHLGAFQYFFGSVLKYLTHHFLRGDPNDNIVRVYLLIKEQYKAYGVERQYREMKVSMYWDGSAQDFPCLKGKAAECRGMVIPLLVVAHALLADDVPIHKVMKKQLEMAVRMEELLDKHKHENRLPLAARAQFKDACFAFAQFNTALGHLFHRQGNVLFHHTIKQHYVCHLGLVAEYINPRLCWCYSGEDLMHKIKLLVQGSHSGTSPLLVPPKVIKRYCIGLTRKLEQAKL